MGIYKLAGAAEIVLILLEATAHWATLPLGGGHAQQVGIIFGSAFVLSEITPGFRRGYDRAVRKIRRLYSGTIRRRKIEKVGDPKDY